jgi:hypothetical protein
MQQPSVTCLAQDGEVRSFKNARFAAALRMVDRSLVHPRPGPLARGPRFHHFPLHLLPKRLLHFAQRRAQLFAVADRRPDRPFDDKIRVDQRENVFRIARLDGGKPVVKKTGDAGRGRLGWRAGSLSRRLRRRRNRRQSQANKRCCHPHDVTLLSRLSISSDPATLVRV